MSHDPTVTAAWISGGIAAAGIAGSTISSWIAIRSGARTAHKSLEAGTDNTKETIRGERAHRLWERRADSYIAAVQFAEYRQMLHENAARQLLFNKEAEEALVAEIGQQRPPATWNEIQVRLHIYGTQPVRDAYAAWAKADVEANKAQGAVASAPAGTGPGQSADAFKKRTEAIKVARTACDALVEAVRTDIQTIDG